MKKAQRSGEIISVRDAAATPIGAGMSLDALKFITAELPRCFGNVMKEIMDKDNIIPANIHIRMIIEVEGHEK